jgi:hypothetical protein
MSIYAAALDQMANDPNRFNNQMASDAQMGAQDMAMSAPQESNPYPPGTPIMYHSTVQPGYEPEQPRNIGPMSDYGYNSQVAESNP